MAPSADGSAGRLLLESRWKEKGMADEPENHTIRLLRELRDEMRVEFAMVRKRF
jgi:hypothetical protein